MNFLIRNFTATEDPILNPVEAAVGIIHCMQMLGQHQKHWASTRRIIQRSIVSFGKPWCTSFDRLVLLRSIEESKLKAFCRGYDCLKSFIRLETCEITNLI